MLFWCHGQGALLSEPTLESPGRATSLHLLEVRKGEIWSVYWRSGASIYQKKKKEKKRSKCTKARTDSGKPVPGLGCFFQFTFGAKKKLQEHPCRSDGETSLYGRNDVRYLGTHPEQAVWDPIPYSTCFLPRWSLRYSTPCPWSSILCLLPCLCGSLDILCQ